MTVKKTRQFRIGRWRVDPAIDTIESDGMVTKLEPRLMNVLLVLSARPGELLTRDELLRTVWPEAEVGDEVLTQAISSLRKHLRDSSRRPTIIQTVPKKGYRLIAEVRDLESGSFHPSARNHNRRSKRRVIVISLIPIVAVLAGMALMWRGSPAPPRLEVVTAMRGRETDPALSPDGTRIAFTWSEDNGGSWDLYVKPLLEGEPARLTQGDELELSPSWSPDGTHLAFARVADGSCEIVVIHSETRAESRIAACRANSYPHLAWSPQGDILAVSDSPGPAGRYVISTMKTDGTDRRQITELVPGLGDRYPAFSRDGRRIAFVRTEGMGASDLYVVDSSGGAVRRLTRVGGAIQGLSWTKDERILFSSRRDGEFLLWSIPASGGAARWLGVAGIRAVKPSWGDAGLVFERQQFDSDIWELPLEEETRPRRLIGSTAWEDEPRVSPDGNEIVYVSRRSGSPELWLCNRAGARSRRLTRAEFRSIHSPRWSPDGQAILFAADERDSSDLYLLERRSERIVRLTNNSSNDLAPGWGPDGKTIYFSSDRDGQWQLLEMNLSDRSSRSILQAPVGAIDLSGDGRHLYFSRMDQPGIWRTVISDGEMRPELVVADFEPSDWANWELRGERLVYLVRNPQRLISLDTKTREVIHTIPVPMSEDDYGLTISADGGSVLFTRGDRTESDLMWLRHNR